MTLAACYGVAADAQDLSDEFADRDGDGWLIDGPGGGSAGLGGEGGEGGAALGGAAPCQFKSSVAEDEALPQELRIDMTMAPLEPLGSCLDDATRSNGIRFRAPTSGLHHFSVEADFPVALAATTYDGVRCVDELACVSVQPGEAGGTSGFELSLDAGEAVVLVASTTLPAPTDGSHATIVVQRP